MCGIAGFVGKGSRTDIEAMTCALSHRGPDGDGYYVDETRAVHLGHRRLAVRDLEGGAQPMWDSADTIGVVFNGEIYNFLELRAELEAAGHIFQTTHSDTEVLVHGYKQWGEGLAERLNGMFAFAILDNEKKRIHLARDRFGEKPLYYSLTSGLFAFSSELEALVRHCEIQRTTSQTAIQKLFAYGYIPAPHALYENTYKLPGGQAITVDLETLTVSQRAYWTFTLAPDNSLSEKDDDRLAEQLRDLIFKSVERRLVSDVPLGIFLSGGIDSSAILSAASHFVPTDNLSTFTIGFNEASYDESDYARKVATHIGAKEHVQRLDMQTAFDLIPDILGRLDEPLGDASLLPTYMLSRYTRENVTVALSGDGGDELFAGYDPFQALKPAALYNRYIPKPAHNLFRTLAEKMPKSGKNMSLDFKVRRTLQGLSYPESVWAPVWMAPLPPEEIQEFFDTPLRLEDLYSEAMDVWESYPAANRVERLLNFFTVLYLQNDILTKVDRASMMCSLETRAIFLDNDLVDFCCKLPSHFKFRGNQRKYLLKKALEPLLPRDILYRRKKGFGIPLADWMRQVPPLEHVSTVPGLRMSYAERKWDEHRQNMADNRFFVWNWLSLQQAMHRQGVTGEA